MARFPLLIMVVVITAVAVMQISAQGKGRKGGGSKGRGNGGKGLRKKCWQDCRDDASGPICTGTEGVDLKIHGYGDCMLSVINCKLTGQGKPALVTTDCPQCAKKCPKPKKRERVCDSTGRVYRSQCIFENAKCLNGELEIGECPAACGKDCRDDESGPICTGTEGVDLKIHGYGDCMLGVINCKRLAHGKDEIVPTECPDCAQKCPRPKKGERVCDSNGRPYPSQCIFENKKCLNGELEIGECPGKAEKRGERANHTKKSMKQQHGKTYLH